MTIEESQAPEEDQRIELRSLAEQRIQVEKDTWGALRLSEAVVSRCAKQDRRRTQAESRQPSCLRGQLDETASDRPDLPKPDARACRNNCWNQAMTSKSRLFGKPVARGRATEADWEPPTGPAGIARIQRLARFNLAARRIQQPIERKTLSGLRQNADLEEALKQPGTGDPQDRQGNAYRFKETFDKITMPAALFPRVFGGACVIWSSP